MSEKNSFYYQTEFFSSRGFRTVAPDFPGFGRSAPLCEEWSVGDYADWLALFFKECALERPHIIAHSFGARVAIKFLASHNFADRLLITGGAGIVRERSPAYMRKVRAYRAVKRIAPAFAERRFGSAEYRALPPVMRGSFKKIVNEDLRACAALVQNKTLLVYGEDDNTTPAGEEGKIFASAIPDSRLAVMQGGHFCFCEHPQAFNARALAFFTED